MSARTLVAKLAELAEQAPDLTALTYLGDGETETQSIAFGVLRDRVAATAARLADAGLCHERVLLQLPPGVDFFVGLLATFSARAIAIPAPVSIHQMDRLVGICQDAGPAAILSTPVTESLCRPVFDDTEQTAGLPWLSVVSREEAPPGAELLEPTDPEIAYLQYTSGSTGAPKGVVITHRNVLANADAAAALYTPEPGDTVVSWLPHFHDMGLMLGYLFPLALALHSVVMPPERFVQRPIRWLRAVSRYRAVVTAGPNFAYDHAASRVREADRSTLDLSCCRAWISGAEPIRASTIDRFQRAFEGSGFSRAAFCPAYGLAEATLLVSGVAPGEEPTIIDPEADRDREATTGNAPLVSCGRVALHTKIAIVDAFGRPCPDGQRGEIWIAGDGVASGYWDKDALNRERFAATLADDPTTRFYRTGDLGFQYSGELFCAGRMDDLIIVRGRNYYPQDIEETVAGAHEAVRGALGAVFALRNDRLVVAQEVRRTHRRSLDGDQVAASIRAAVARRHGLRADTVLLLRPHALPRTANGKTQRKRARSGFQSGELEALHRSDLEPVDREATSPFGGDRAADLGAFLTQWVATESGLPAGQIDHKTPLAAYGLDSMKCVELALAVGEYLDREVVDSLALDHPTIDDLVAHLVGEVRQATQRRGARHTSEPIAVVGLGCRFPGGIHDAESFWECLDEGRDTIGPVPPGRWSVDAESVPPTIAQGGFLDDIEMFDAGFFGISPREAVSLDPQQRLLLECSWEALEDAGTTQDALSNSMTGVFIGMSGSEYGALLAEQEDGGVDIYAGTGTAPSVASGRVAYWLGLNGPALTVDTACSSSLVAIHLACQALRSGEADLALSGGVNLILTPERSMVLASANALSPTGRCRPFSAEADGYVRSEGCGIVALKRLSDARRSGDRVLAVILGSCVNQDGRSQGLTAPNGPAQQRAIQQALATAGRSPDQVHYVEAHGTGTPLGDPIEFSALSRAIGELPEDRIVHVGSVKSNIGHCEAAAGVAGLIKTILALRHSVIPPTIHTSSLNPRLASETGPLRVATTRTEWPAAEVPRVAGVSSFGISGTNAHLVLQEAPREPLYASEPRPSGALAVPISAPNGALLEAKVRQLDRDLDNDALGDLVAEACDRRGHDAYRVVLLAEGLAELRKAACADLDGGPADTFVRGRAQLRGKAVFVFDHSWDQARRLTLDFLQADPSFDSRFREVEAAIRQETGTSLFDWLGSRLFEAEVHTRPDLAIPLDFALSMTFAEAWRGWGVEPDLVLGDGPGLIAAACVADAIDVAEGAHIASSWGALLAKSTGRGGVAIVGLPLAATAERLAPTGSGLSLSANSSREETVVTGDRVALGLLLARLQREGIQGHTLDVDFRRNTNAAMALREELSGSLRSLKPTRPALPIYSKRHRRPVEGDALDADFWVEELVRGPSEAEPWLAALHDAGTRFFIELGVAPTSAERTDVQLASRGLPGTSTSWDFTTSGSSRRQFLRALGELFVQGYPVRWSPQHVEQPSPAPQTFPTDDPSQPVLLCVSARSEAALRGQLRSIGRHLESQPQVDLRDVSFSLATTRTHFDHRATVVATSPRDAADAMARLANAELPAAGKRDSRVAFSFGDRGGQYPEMGRSLYAREPVFRDALQHCQDALADQLDRSLPRVLFAQPGTRDADCWGEFRYSQPALFALQYALACLWRSWGVEPSAVLGTGVGEIAAACVAGMLAPADGLHLSAARGRSLDSSPSSFALADFTDLAESIRYTEPTIPILTDNSGTTLTEPAELAQHWIRHARDSVQSTEETNDLDSLHIRTVVELGPHPSHRSAGLSSLRDEPSIRVLHSLREGEDDVRVMLEGLAQWYLDGGTVDWRMFHQARGGRWVELPKYPFQRVRYWPHRTREQVRRPPAEEPIAIIGLGCRLPGGVVDADSLWSMLASGTDATSEVPRDRWDSNAWYDETPGTPGKTYTRRGSFLGDVAGFDAPFFGISPREAAPMDPQQRLVLEVAWEALEDAGIVPRRIEGSATGVFLGVGYSGYGDDQIPYRNAESISLYSGTGTLAGFCAGRLSHFLGLRGPALSLDTACSSSLVALHLACQSLRDGESDLALTGGVQVLCSPVHQVYLSSARALSADGRCKTLSAEADGYGRGEGCGVFVLKRLSDAERDGNHIHALIVGSALSHDGHTQGLTVPSRDAQERVFRSALANAHLSPSDVQYVELHGTGTPVGDPIEASSVDAVYGQSTRNEPVLVGSVKTNIGHLEAAAGAAGLLKVIVSLQHGTLPRHLHAEHLNPAIPWERTNLRVTTEETPWPSAPGRRVAAVNASGMTGTNAHVLVQEPPHVAAPAEPIDRSPELVCISAQTPSALPAQAARLRDHLVAHSNLSLGAIAGGLARTRTHFPYRAVVVAQDRQQLLEDLTALSQGRRSPSVLSGRESTTGKVAFLFTGQGSQYPGMGRGLYDREPIFREAFDHCIRLFELELEKPLEDVLFSAPGSRSAAQLDETLYTQPALFTLEWALAELWRSWGVEPARLLGHSIGEFVAACVAGVFAVEDAVRLVAARAQLMHQQPRGSMISVRAAEMTVAARLAPVADRVSIAAINGPSQTVISGETETVESLAAQFASEGIDTNRLSVSHAFHSALMDGMLSPFAEVAKTVEYSPARIPIVSNVTGGLATEEFSTPEYWIRQVREPVRYFDCAHTLFAEGVDTLVEIGPRPTLLALTTSSLPDDANLRTLPSLRKGQDDASVSLRSLGQWFADGGDVNWDRVQPSMGERYVPLPTYAFERERHWLATPVTPDPHNGNDEILALLTQGDTTEIAESLATAALSPEERTALPAILDALVAYRKGLRARGGVREWLYRTEWRPAPMHSALISGRPDATGLWIVLLDDGGVCEHLAQNLESHGGRVTRVSRHEKASLRARLEVDEPVRGVVCGWALDGATHSETPNPEILLSTPIAILETMQDLASGTFNAPCYFLTCGATPRQGAIPAPEQAMVWGLGRALSLEHPDHWGALVDLPEALESAAYHDDLLKHLCAPDGEDHVSLTPEGRLAARLVRYSPGPAKSPVLAGATEGTILVTGGLGAIGRRIAEWLVGQRRVRNLLLVGRRGILTPGAEAFVRSLETQGATVEVSAADVCDTKAMAEIVSAIPDDRPLVGIFHAAGLAELVPLQQQTADDLRRVARPKVVGTRVLEEVAQGQPVQTFVALSSIAGVWGSSGQASYASANAFLDAWAQEGSEGVAQPIRRSLSFGPWLGEGMATAEIREGLAQRGVRATEPESALAALEVALSQSERHLVIADIDWPRFMDLYEARGRRPLLEAFRQPTSIPASTPSRTASDLSVSPQPRLAALSDDERRDWLGEWLRQRVADLLGYGEANEILPQTRFSDLGMDSLIALELRQCLRELLGTEISGEVIFDFPSVDALAAELARSDYWA